jgi:ribA/ribD-fused uncharacterized protein
MADILVFGFESTPNFEFANAAPHGFTEEGVEWLTVEHYVHAHQFLGEKHAELREKIRKAPRPRKVVLLAQANARHVRPDWQEVRDEIMLRALRLKFADPDLAHKLLNTGNIALAFDDNREKYWSIGLRGEGQNRLGNLLMQVRDELGVKPGSD